LLLAPAVLAARIWLHGRRWARVSSIERTAEYQDPALLEEAFRLPAAAAYRREGFLSQTNPSFCGPTTAIDAIRSLGMPAPAEHFLDGTPFRTWFGLLPSGMTLDELAQLLRQKTGRRVLMMRDLDPPSFRKTLALANDPARRMTLNFDRGPLFGRGGGHHSPVGAYLADRDLLLVLDVNASFRPWLAKTDRVFEAMNTVDPETGRTRGLLVIEP
jgi:hypothetical protein